MFLNRRERSDGCITVDKHGHEPDVAISHITYFMVENVVENCL